GGRVALVGDGEGPVAPCAERAPIVLRSRRIPTWWPSPTRTKPVACQLMRRHAPALPLFLLSPFLAEVVFGATPLSRLGGLVPLLFFYGGGVLIIRDLARRRGPGWWRILLLGAAYAIVEEGLVIQSVFNPDLFHAGELGGRVLGVNGVWTEWAIAYHATYSVAIPILLAEILFPSRRDEPWLGPRSMAFLGLLYLLSAAVIGLAFRRIIAPGFQATILQVLAA